MCLLALSMHWGTELPRFPVSLEATDLWESTLNSPALAQPCLSGPRKEERTWD